MKMRTLKAGFISLGFAILLLTGVGAMPAQAQQWTYAEGRQVRFKSDVEQRGYRDGLRRGRLDARSDVREDLKDIASYRNGDAAYKYGFRRGYYEGKNKIRQNHFERYSTDSWYRW
jgi:hypothetical protein